MESFKKINYFLENDPMASVLSAFLAGLLFSGVSFGLIYVLLFFLFWEILYIGYLDCNNEKWDFGHRVLLIMSALLGFLIGAFFHGSDDHYNSYNKFRKDMDYYGKELGWFE